MKPIEIATDRRPLLLEVQPEIVELMRDWSDPVRLKFVSGFDGRVTLMLRMADDDT